MFCLFFFWDVSWCCKVVGRRKEAKRWLMWAVEFVGPGGQGIVFAARVSWFNPAALLILWLQGWSLACLNFQEKLFLYKMDIFNVSSARGFRRTSQHPICIRVCYHTQCYRSSTQQLTDAGKRCWEWIFSEEEQEYRSHVHLVGLFLGPTSHSSSCSVWESKSLPAT